MHAHFIHILCTHMRYVPPPPHAYLKPQDDTRTSHVKWWHRWEPNVSWLDTELCQQFRLTDDCTRLSDVWCACVCGMWCMCVVCMCVVCVCMCGVCRGVCGVCMHGMCISDSKRVTMTYLCLCGSHFYRSESGHGELRQQLQPKLYAHKIQCKFKPNPIP